MRLPHWTSHRKWIALVLGVILVWGSIISIGFLAFSDEGGSLDTPTTPHLDSRLTRLQVTPTPSPSPTLTASPTLTPKPIQESPPVVAEVVSLPEVYHPAPLPQSTPAPQPQPTPKLTPKPTPTPPPTPILSEDVVMSLINDYLRQNDAGYAWHISDCESSWADYIWEFTCAREWVTNPFICISRGISCPTTNTLEDGFLVFEDTRQVVQTRHYFLAI